MSRETGVSLIEAMVTLSIVAILLTLGVPGLIDLVRDVRRESHVLDIAAHLKVARSEAIKRGNRVTLCPSGNGAACLGTARWESGWIVFTDPNGNGVVDVTEVVLMAHGRLEDGSTFRGGRPRITYQRTGYSLGFNDTLKLCDASGAEKAREVIVSNQGRVRLVKGAATCP